ncbi:hypothetical protein [Archangium lipolyticum]|uniref:hypothetical protein n=1 Tax=Archangium lipolyticum TaxID=2970465 RepID=UPI00214A2DE3|nr:hypothetical protein [Archangium lipolyticum]
MRRSATLLLISSALLALAGCKSSCRELSERLCDCVEPVNRTICLQAVADEQTRVEETEEQLAACEEKLTTCVAPPPDEQDTDPNNQDEEAQNRRFCAFIRTDKGKQDCGLAR